MNFIINLLRILHIDSFFDLIIYLLPAFVLIGIYKGFVQVMESDKKSYQEKEKD